ncbi:MAG: MerC domain-containing protein [Gammaproteobacteria bacterium]
MDHVHDKTETRLDSMAVAMSIVCILHCLMTPVLVTLFPIVAGTVLADHQFHAFLLILIIPTSAIALYLGCRRHKSGLVFSLGLSGMIILSVVAYLGPEGLTVTGEKVATGFGGLILASAHVLNFYRCREMRCTDNHHVREKS